MVVVVRSGVCFISPYAMANWLCVSFLAQSMSSKKQENTIKNHFWLKWAKLQKINVRGARFNVAGAI